MTAATCCDRPITRFDVWDAMSALMDEGKNFSLFKIRERMGVADTRDNVAAIAAHALDLIDAPGAFEPGTLKVDGAGRVFLKGLAAYQEVAS